MANQNDESMSDEAIGHPMGPVLATALNKNKSVSFFAELTLLRVVAKYLFYFGKFFFRLLAGFWDIWKMFYIEVVYIVSGKKNVRSVVNASPPFKMKIKFEGI